MSGDGMRATRTFLASFLVLFLEIALIRWMPAYIRLLSYFSNFILLASFLGIGIGCLLAPVRAAAVQAGFRSFRPSVIAAVYFFRLEVSVPTAGSIYFSSGTAEKVVLVESTMLLPLLFVIVAALFATLAQRMGREMAQLPPLRAYTINLAGSLAGVVVLGVDLVAGTSADGLVRHRVRGGGAAAAVARPEAEAGAVAVPRRAARFSVPVIVINLALLAVSLALVSVMARGAIWSPYYKITVSRQGADTVVEVNNIFHQSMAPVEQKEYFYQWPYSVFGDTFQDVLILGAGSGTDVAAALRHGVRHVDAVEIDPAIIRLGREHHPDHPYSDPRVTVINDDARHYLRTTKKHYDLVVFALIDSLTMQSSFSGVRLESYMFTEESFSAVRDRLKPDGVLVVYNYFREHVAGRSAREHRGGGVRRRAASSTSTRRRAFLGVLMAGPRLAQLTAPPTRARPGHRLQPVARTRARRGCTSATVDRAGDRRLAVPLHAQNRHLPRHYAIALGIVLVVSARLGAADALGARASAPAGAAAWSWQFFLLGAGFMLLETKSIIQFALLWGSTWVVGVAGDRVGADDGARRRTSSSRAERSRGRGSWRGVLVALLALNYLVPVGRVAFDSRAAESLFYAVLVFSPILCAGLLFGSAIATIDRRSRATTAPTCSARWSAASANTCRSSPAIARCCW